jgi:hypothetical protein
LLLYQSDRLFNMLPKSRLSEAQQMEIAGYLTAANVTEKPAFGFKKSRLVSH